MFCSSNFKLHTNFIENFDHLDRHTTILENSIKLSDLNAFKLENPESLILSPEILRDIFFIQLITSQRVLITSKNYSLNCNLSLCGRKVILTIDWLLNLALITESDLGRLILFNPSLIQIFSLLIMFRNLTFSTKITKQLRLVGNYI